MSKRYRHHDHYCELCGKKIEDGENYIRDDYGKDYCEKCWDKKEMKEE